MLVLHALFEPFQQFEQFADQHISSNVTKTYSLVHGLFAHRCQQNIDIAVMQQLVAVPLESFHFLLFLGLLICEDVLLGLLFLFVGVVGFG